VSVALAGEGGSITEDCTSPEWRPTPEQWETVKRRSLGRSARITVSALSPKDGEDSPVSSATIAFQTSPDSVAAPVFYREVPLPVGFAMDNKPLIRRRK
jgi:hypothetical protein